MSTALGTCRWVKVRREGLGRRVKEEEEEPVLGARATVGHLLAGSQRPASGPATPYPTIQLKLLVGTSYREAAPWDGGLQADQVQVPVH